jgi:hypothetical protein
MVHMDAAVLICGRFKVRFQVLINVLNDMYVYMISVHVVKSMHGMEWMIYIR